MQHKVERLTRILIRIFKRDKEVSGLILDFSLHPRRVDNIPARIVGHYPFSRLVERLDGLEYGAVSRFLVEVLIPEQRSTLSGENSRDP